MTALAMLDAGRFELVGREARLIPPAEADPARFEAALAALATSLPPGYAMPLALAESEPTARAETPTRAAWLRAVRDGGALRLRGAVPDEATHDAVVGYATAMLDATDVVDELRVGGVTAAEGWRRAALSLLDGLSPLNRGEGSLRAGTVRVSGVALDTGAVAAAHRALAPTVEAGWRARTEISVDMAAAMAAALLPPEACEAALREAKAAEPIDFDPSEAALDGRSAALLDRIAATLRRCQPTIVEIGGHTDSQGSDDYNRRLSAARAASVRDALMERDTGGMQLIAHGYGSAEPIADNATQAGRALNRRIAFRWVSVADAVKAPSPTSADGPATVDETMARAVIGDAPPAIVPKPRP
jgi:OOP family OmpA-OmpF porin